MSAATVKKNRESTLKGGRWWKEVGWRHIVAAPQAAQAAQEPGATKIDVGEVSAWMGKGITNGSETDETTDYNNFIRYGIVKGMTEERIRTGNTPVTTSLGGPYAKANDAWTYIARGMPWKWDDQSVDYGDPPR